MTVAIGRAASACAGEPMRGNALWTEERIVLLKELWADGATANVIAAQLGACRDLRSWERFFACAWATALRNRLQRRVQKRLA